MSAIVLESVIGLLFKRRNCKSGRRTTRALIRADLIALRAARLA